MVYLRLSLSSLAVCAGAHPAKAVAVFMFRKGNGWDGARDAGSILREQGWRAVAITDVYECFDSARYHDGNDLRSLQAQAEAYGYAYRIVRCDETFGLAEKPASAGLFGFRLSA